MSWRRETSPVRFLFFWTQARLVGSLAIFTWLQMPLPGNPADHHQGDPSAPGSPPSLSANLDSRPEFLGTIEAAPDLTVAVTATLWGKIYPEEGILPGVWVKKGQPLARTVLELDSVERLALEDRTIDVRNSLEAAKERARTALENYRRAMEVAKTKPDFEDEVERRKKIYNTMLKSLELINQQNRRQGNVIKSRDPRIVVITAPISGYVSQMNFVPGEVNPFGTFRQIFTLVNLSAVWVRADIPEKDLKLFRDRPDAVVTTPAYPGETFPGRFQGTGSQLDPINRTLPIFFQADNPGEKLKLGLPVRIQLADTNR